MNFNDQRKYSRECTSCQFIRFPNIIKDKYHGAYDNMYNNNTIYFNKTTMVTRRNG